jgi:hypothetical protein
MVTIQPEYLKKKRSRLLVLVTLAAVLGMALAGCDQGGGEGNDSPTPADEVKAEWEDAVRGLFRAPHPGVFYRISMGVLTSGV